MSRYLSSLRGVTALVAIVALYAVALLFGGWPWVRKLAVAAAAVVGVLSAWHEWRGR